MAEIRLNSVSKQYEDGTTAVHSFTLDIKDGEFLVFVGPSGCGKSTTLRMIAGLEKISGGDIYINDERVNDLTPKQRNIAMVFQSYALYPHKSVYKNLSFPLENSKVSKSEIDKRVRETAEVLGLTPYLKRRPRALSGGQKQRVALGRAMVRNPSAFLLDEPLSNLDAKLRTVMRNEIKKLHNELGTTFIYVTHDQTEAMTMGDRIAVMKDGYIQQVDTPANIYNCPCNTFVAGFIGTTQINFINALVLKEGENFKLRLYKNTLFLPAEYAPASLEKYAEKEITLAIRPEDFTVCNPYKEDNENTITSIVDIREILGDKMNLYMEYGSERICATLDANENITEEHHLTLKVNIKKIHLFDKSTGLLIR